MAFEWEEPLLPLGESGLGRSFTCTPKVDLLCQELRGTPRGAFRGPPICSYSEPFAVPGQRWCCGFPLLGHPAQAPTHLATDAHPQLQRAPPGACHILSITSNLMAAGAPSDASSTSRENAGQPG